MLRRMGRTFCIGCIGAAVTLLLPALQPGSGYADEGGGTRPPGSLLPPELPSPPPPLPPSQQPQSSPADRESEVRDWLRVSHGVSAGDVDSHSAVIWARSSDPGLMHVVCDTDPKFSHANKEPSPASAIEAADYTASLKLTDLQPGTRYYYRVWFSSGLEQIPALVSRPVEGQFTTAPDSMTSTPVTFLWGGDLGGQKYCRRAGKGYTIFGSMEKTRADFFLALGNMIYADDGCPVGGPDGEMVWENVAGDFPDVTDPAISWDDVARVRDIFWRHWRYNRSDPHFQKFLAATSMYATWNDHEVLGDFGASWDYPNDAGRNRPGYRELVIKGRDAFLQYAPIARDSDDINRIYRSFRWGADCQLFVLDTRSYRSRNDLADTPANRKTMLGPEQLEWLRRGLIGSRATWKIVACAAPLSIPTGVEGVERDGWASGAERDSTGFERELLDLMTSLDRAKVENIVFLTADDQWSAEIRYEKDLNGDGRALVLHELASGPLSASKRKPIPLDRTLNPKLLYGDGGFYSFGVAHIERKADGKAHFTAEIRDENGDTRSGSVLDLTAR